MDKIRHFEKITWFPGHMYAATQKVISEMKHFDIFIEIRDARVPYSSMNYELDDHVKAARKKKITIFNKYDLCHQQVTLNAIQNLTKVGLYGFPTIGKERVNINKIVELSNQLLPPKFGKSIGCWAMIGGMPNMGKSTIINKLRLQSPQIRGNYVTKVSKSPAETKHVSGFKISSEPKTWIIDTPGIMVPSLIEEEQALNLSLVGSIKDSIYGREVLVEYLFSFLSKNSKKKYMEVYKLQFEPKNYMELITMLANRYGEHDNDRTCHRILIDFREGRLGNFTLDNVENIL